MAGPLPDRFSVSLAKDTPPQPVKIDRDYRTRRPGDDLHHARLKRLHLSGAGDSALREDAHQLTIDECLPRGLQRPHDRLRTVGRLDGDHPHRLAEPAEARLFGVVPPHEKPDHTCRQARQQNAVHPRHMVRDQQRPAPFRNVLLADHTDPIDRAARQPEQEPDRDVRQQTEGVDHHRNRAQSGHHENLSRREVEVVVQQSEQTAGEQNERECDEVAPGENRPARADVAAVLEVRLQRHVEQPRTDAEQNQAHARPEERLLGRFIGRGGDPTSGHKHQQRTHCNPHGPQRHQSQFDPSARPVPGQQASRPDPQHQHEQQDPDADRRQVQHLGPVTIDVELRERGHGPEERDPQCGPPEAAVRFQQLQSGERLSDRIDGHPPRGVGGRTTGDQQARSQPDRRNPQQRHGRRPERREHDTVLNVRLCERVQSITGDGPQCRGDDRHQPHHPVPFREVMQVEYLRQTPEL